MGCNLKAHMPLNGFIFKRKRQTGNRAVFVRPTWKSRLERNTGTKREVKKMLKSDLHYRMIGSDFTISAIAESLGISRYALYKKINGEIKWNQREIDILCSLLRIEEDEKGLFF